MVRWQGQHKITPEDLESLSHSISTDRHTGTLPNFHHILRAILRGQAGLLFEAIQLASKWSNRRLKTYRISAGCVGHYLSWQGKTQQCCDSMQTDLQGAIDLCSFMQLPSRGPPAGTSSICL